MKKLKLGAVLVVVIMALVGSTAALAAGHCVRHSWYAEGTGNTPACVWADGCRWDTDGDGTCGGWNGTCTDADGDGICDVCGRTGLGYADADGDGVCDHYGSWHAGGGHHGGQRHCRW